MSQQEENEHKPDPGVLKLKDQGDTYVASPMSQKEPPKTRAWKKKHKQQQKNKGKQPSGPGKKSRLRFIILSGMPFVMSFLILGTFLLHQVLDWQILTQQQAIFSRNVLILSFFVILVIEAFTEDVLQGVLCLFVPPYSILYGIFVADAGPIKGLTMAIICFLGAEMFFTPDDAMVPVVQNAVNSFIKTNQARLLDPYD